MFRRSVNWCCVFVAVFAVTNSIAVEGRVGAGEAVTAHQGPAADRSPPGAASEAAAACRPPSPGGADASLLHSLPGEEKGRRLIQAAKDGAVGELQALLAAGADPGWRGADLNWTALHWAAFWGHAPAVGCLLAAGAPVDAPNNYRATPLHFAAGSGHEAAVRLLLAHSADPDAEDDDLQTPLHWAAEAGHAGATAALLAAGADRAATDSQGHRPADLARQNGHRQLADELAPPPPAGH